VRIATVDQDDFAPVLAMIDRCSTTTLYRRFHGFLDVAAFAAAQVAADAGRDAVLAWCGERCVGLASLYDDGAGCADLGVLVEDAWQRRGVGTALVRALLRRATARGLTCLRVDLVGDNHVLLPALRRIGPLRTSAGSGGYRVHVDLVAGRAA
jgi:GNAT superfamily N-acetyltransferase